MSNLVNHAKQELERAGFAEDASIGQDIISLMEHFSGLESAGNIYAAASCVNTFAKLAAFQPLTPISSNPDEWTNVSEAGVESLWQSKRNPSVFSKDGGKTWCDLDNPSPEIGGGAGE